MKTLLLFLLMLPVTIAYGQESFRRAFTLRRPIILEGDTTITLERDTLIKKSTLVPDRNAPVAINKRFITTSGAVQILSGSLELQTDSILIKKKSVLKLWDILILKHDVDISFAQLPADEQAEIRGRYTEQSLIYTIERSLPMGKVIAQEHVPVDEAFYEKLKVKKSLAVKVLPADEGFALLEDNKVWVNPNLSARYQSKGLFYYQLNNRQSIKLHVSEVTVSALTLPLKYRFKQKKDNEKIIPEEFTTAVNLNAFIGYTPTFFGTTKFHYREKVGNITTTQKATFGAIIGASTVTLDKGNTSAADNPILDDTKITKGLLTLGGGVIYSRNKLNGGLFLGWDFSVGDNAARWNYNRRPWLGVAVGYSLFPF